MHVIYAPEDGDKQEWTWDPGRVKASEGQVLLSQYGEKNWDLFVQGIRQNDLHARRVLLWHLIRRTHPLVKFADVPDFYADEITVEFSAAELAELLDKVAASPAPADQKAQAITVLQTELEVARAREDLAADDGGKDSPLTSGPESTTGG